MMNQVKVRPYGHPWTITELPKDVETMQAGLVLCFAGTSKSINW